MRYKVRRGQKGWLVWDTKTGTVAVVDRSFAIDLSAETANLFACSLNALERGGPVGHPIDDEKNAT